MTFLVHPQTQSQVSAYGHMLIVHKFVHNIICKFSKAVAICKIETLHRSATYSVSTDFDKPIIHVLCKATLIDFIEVISNNTS